MTDKSQIPNPGENPKSQIPNPNNNVERIFMEDGSCEGFARGYFRYLAELFEKMDINAIARVAELLELARRAGKQIFFMGNGGSASTASHFVNDLVKGTRVDDKAPYRTISLVDNISHLTAIANDEGYDRIFIDQLAPLLNEGDIVVGISASGNSPNVVKAIEYANAHGAKTVGLTGFSGGTLREIVHHALHVETPKGEYGPVEDVHMILDHLITCFLKLRLESVE